MGNLHGAVLDGVARPRAVAAGRVPISIFFTDLTGKLFLRWRLGTPTLQIHLAYLTAAAFPADAA